MDIWSPLPTIYSALANFEQPRRRTAGQYNGINIPTEPIGFTGVGGVAFIQFLWRATSHWPPEGVEQPMSSYRNSRLVSG